MAIFPLRSDVDLSLVERPSVPSGPPAPARPHTLVDVFDDTLRRWPTATALDGPDATLTYRELAAAADRVADELRALGVGPGDRVGVRIPGGTSRLYISILGVLRAGAAYVPVDAEDPAERAQLILGDADVCAVIEERATRRHRPGAGAGRDLDAAHDAWVIFTSGSTGRPKGVAVSHRSATAFVAAESELWTVSSEDRVLAGLSVGFDASCEEIWLAWANGAALVPAPRCVVRSGPDLGDWLIEHEISVISTVPTLAGMWDEQVLRGVRLLILGGEACPDALAWRLAAHCETWNTYGPTEATVVTTAARLRPDAPVVIGTPLTGWQVAVVDEAGVPVTPGDPGELAIAGVGLGRYLDPTLDRERYAALPACGWDRAYRTGDVVRETPTGLAFVGRTDDQVKIGGRRIELGEIETQLRAVPGVDMAAASVQRRPDGSPLLVGYVVGRADPASIRERLADRLPSGVVPLIVPLDALPVAPSGKTDRRALPWPPPDSAAADVELSADEAWLADAWRAQLGPLPIAPDSDFFALGGTSVAAAKLVSQLRSRYPAVAVADVYGHRTLADQAAHLASLVGATSTIAAPESTSTWRWAAAQLVGVFALITVTVPVWLEGVFLYSWWSGTGPQVAWPWLVAGWLAFISPPGRTALAVTSRRLLLHDVGPGRYPRHGSVAYRIWFLDRLEQLLRIDRLAGTPWAGRVARLLGADVGSGARLGTLPHATSLSHIGALATVESAVETHGWWIEGHELVMGEIRIGAGARVGTRSVLMPGAVIGDGAEIEPGSVVSTVVPAGERWAGSPARYVGPAGEDWPEERPPARPRRTWKLAYAFGLAGLNITALVAALPAFLLLDALGAGSGSGLEAMRIVLVTSPVLAAAFILGEAVITALAFRAAGRLIRPGLHPDTGSVAWALWFTGALNANTLKSLFPLYATVYTRAWLRLHGLKIGRRTEVSTTEGLNHLVELGECSFVVDHPMFAGAQAHRGWLRLEPITIGDRSFVGNGGILLGGTRVGDEALVGIESNAPSVVPDGTSWFGNPALELPRVADATDPARTTNPPRRLVIARGAVELVRILLPTTVSIVLGGLVFVALNAMGRAFGVLGILLAAPFVVALAGIAAVAVTVALKWVVIGRYRAGESPLWSSFVWRDEIINSCQEQLASEWLLELGLGSPVISLYLRAMGATIGRDVWCDTLAITEFDVVTIGDGCAVNRGACIETHLFHDRVLKIGPTELEAGSTLGPVTAILPDTRLGAGAVVGARSVVLRGEELPPRTRWHGAPVVSMPAAA